MKKPISPKTAPVPTAPEAAPPAPQEKAKYILVPLVAWNNMYQFFYQGGVPGAQVSPALMAQIFGGPPGPGLLRGLRTLEAGQTV